MAETTTELPTATREGLAQLVTDWREHALALQQMADLARERREKTVIGLSPYEVGADWDWYAQAFLEHAAAVEAWLPLRENSHVG